MQKRMQIGVAILALLFSFQHLAWAQQGEEEQTVLRLLNLYRGQHGLPVVVLSPALGRAANVHSRWMADHNCFAHQCGLEPEFGQRLLNASYRWQNGAAENIAAGRSSAERTVQMWVNSPPHNANLLDPRWRAVGISRVYNAASRYHWYWTLDFGDVVDPSVTAQAAPARALNGSRERLAATIEVNPGFVRFELGGAVRARVQVFNLAGRVVFDSGLTSARTLNWNLLLGGGLRAANGVYFYVLSTQNGADRAVRSAVRKIVIAR